MIFQISKFIIKISTKLYVLQYNIRAFDSNCSLLDVCRNNNPTRRYYNAHSLTEKKFLTDCV